MANNNTIQKLLIKNLTQTHNDAVKAYQKTLAESKTMEQKEQIKKIAKYFNIKGV